jgi:hypothetical protein
LTSIVVLVQPSTAAAERVFSIMRRNFDECNFTAMQDVIGATCMIQYNERTSNDDGEVVGSRKFPVLE